MFFCSGIIPRENAKFWLHHEIYFCSYRCVFDLIMASTELLKVPFICVTDYFFDALELGIDERAR